MFKRQPTKSGLSPLRLAVIVTVAGVVALAALLLYTSGTTMDYPGQTSMIAKARTPEEDRNPTLVVISDATATNGTPFEDETALATPDIPTPSQPPDPTPYLRGPTAQFSTLIPMQEWLVYLDAQAGFSIKYPPDWYLNTTPPEERVFGSTTQLLSWDPKDPDPVPKGTKRPENFIKLEIVSDSLRAMGRQFLPDETLAEWVQRTRPRSGDEMQILEEGETTLGGLPAYFQKTSYKGSEAIVYYVHRGANMVYIWHWVSAPNSIHEQVIENMLATLTFFE